MTDTAPEDGYTEYEATEPVPDPETEQVNEVEGEPVVPKTLDDDEEFSVEDPEGAEG